MMVANSILFLLLILASSATDLLASSSPVEKSPSVNSYSSRLLTYGCSSKNDYGGRRLIDRILTHPCNSKPQTSTSTSSLYEKNSSKDNTLLIVTLGVISGVLTIFGLLFLVDRETFTQITGVKEVPYYCDCNKYRIDADEDDESEPTPYERDVYLTRETADYLEQKHDKEVEQPRRKFKSITKNIKHFFCWWWPTKKYEGDKYQVPWTGSEDDWEKEQLAGKQVNVIKVMFEEIRLRLCWRPTKEYDEEDKYNVDLGDNDEIKYAASSYESAEKGTAPW